MANVLRKKSRSEAPRYAESEVVPLNPVEAPPQTVGDMLREKREEFDIDLREAADYLRIRYVYLLALEEGRVDDLPGATYALGFVRAYADYLGLDGASIVERYKDETAVMDDDVRLVFPSPLPEGKIPSAAILLVSVVALILVYVGWVVFAQQNVRIAELVPALPEKFAALLGSDEDSGKAAPTAPTAAQLTQTTPTQAPAPEPARAPKVQAVAVPPVETAASATTERAPADKLPEKMVAAAPETRPAPVAAPVAETPAVTAPGVGNGAANSAAAAQGTAGQAVAPVAAATASVPAAPPVPETSPTAMAAAPTDAGSTEAAVQPQQEAPAVTVAPTGTEEDSAVPLPPQPPAVAESGPRQYGSENADSRVIIRARIDSWVEVRDPADDKLLLTRVLRAGDSYRVPDRPGLLMETGNAGGLEISVDGKVIPDIGPLGAVRHDIALDADSLKTAVQ